ncbi:YbhN family protein [Allocoleopsis sp.]|uniref:YbhN family protein n=1 Tax=Allocoleopsis sp. TaxID=3088169 RepID=UPI002FCF3289
MKKIWSLLKPYLRWVILGGTLFFLAKAFKEHWQEVALIQINAAGWTMLFVAFSITLLAHILAGLVWSWILRSFKQPIQYRWVLLVYLKTNVAKYLPGNVWHYYGRIWAVTKAGGSLSAATISVLLEPLLMAAAALLIALTGSQLDWLDMQGDTRILGLQILGLAGILLAVHPKILNPVLQLLRRFKGKATDTEAFQLDRYPFVPLLGELGFVGLRGAGFLVTFFTLSTVNPNQIPLLLTAFSLAWVLGLVIPTPGGLGVFETTVLGLLNPYFSTGVILSVVALFRLMSILAEVVGASIGVLCDRV